MKTIPLQGGLNYAHQTFMVAVNSKSYLFDLNYVTTGEYWSLNISIDNTIQIAGMLLMPNCEISKPFNKPELGKFYMIGEQPTLENLGIENQLLIEE